MYSQLFSPYNLYSCTTQSERRNSRLNKDDFAEKVDLLLGNSINDGTYQFAIKAWWDLFLNNHPKGSLDSLCQNLILRKLYKNIKRIYGIGQSNRNLIVKQMVSLLIDGSHKWIIRLDIRNFYESIERSLLMERFQEDGRLNYQSISLLKNLFANPSISEKKGLPRGLSISSVMSELYMKYFDLEIRRMEGVFYYARFVDDIIIFCSSKISQENIWIKIPKLLSNIGLQLNESKSYKWDNQQKILNLTYLGYTFFPKEKNIIEITIADKKVNIIKTRITKSFVRFAKDGDFDKLKNRIKFLTGNFTIYNPSTLLPIRIGIYFNYNMITSKNSLYELDKYYQRLLHCRTGRLGTRLRIQMTVIQQKELSKYSFVFGFERHVRHYFTSAMIADITNCWR
ncbi:RNA-directed DNA polymerase [Prevotella sp. oral taxon 306 str. F0472]|uniref:antiviral reverse transcriptase Drt3a n=1 Tax=Prevotella sp. oral taxon 306 TaxID=712461 RepID=UPI00025BA357|nr:antiviral reverse transcriptase Drt3a [Prevotella sp. oral taxon 306]EID33793.1 RNA-directed DNA polymerase [Prevotella sp. oral taxon 306 str. F0472]